MEAIKSVMTGRIRTQQGKPVLQKDGKWSTVLENYGGTPGDEYLHSTFTSAAVWETEDQALDGGDRALDTLEQTGRYPNMCEVW